MTARGTDCRRFTIGYAFLRELIELGLLLEAVHTGRSGGFLFQGEVHALPAVLLGVTWPDAFDGDAEPQPPDTDA